MSGLSRGYRRRPSWVCACVSGTKPQGVLEAQSVFRYRLSCLDHSLPHHAGQLSYPDKAGDCPLPTPARGSIRPQLPL